MARRRRPDDELPDEPAPTAQPSEAPRGEDQDDRLVPEENVGGAAPSSGLDSGGVLPGTEDDLANLAEPEPPEAPEVDAVHLRREGAGTKNRRQRLRNRIRPRACDRDRE